ncbi:hypothetical protein SLS53_005943 [Cytospora paraplurivora]|uniref:LysM domain-containing protein n=1 Tax=Cytospora paraplurivora TaxID=2898453 RepID=A0AAN9YFQ3_9PEZI
MSANDYYRDAPHEGHHDAPPRRDDYEPRERGDGDRPDFYSHEGGGERGHGGHKQEGGEHDRGLIGTLAGGAAGAFGGHALGGRAGHGTAGTILGAVAGAFAGHETEEKVEEWKEERKEKKQEHRYEEDERRHERDDYRRHDEPHYGGGGPPPGGPGYGQGPPPPGGYGQGPPRGGGDEVQVTVQPGDTLRGIAARFDGVSLEDILRHNQIQNPDLIYPGQVINVPARHGGGGGGW